jgi:beta-galactosidase
MKRLCSIMIGRGSSCRRQWATGATLAVALALTSCASQPRSGPGGLQQSKAQASARERISFNTDWRFVKDDPNGTADKLSYKNIRDWVMATGAEFTDDPNLAARKRPAGNLGADVAYTQAEFNDQGWRPVTLPHDWGIEGPFKQEYDGGTGRLPWFGVAWYRKHFTVPAGDQGRQLYLDMDGAMSYANVWLNGQYVGGWPYGYASWRVNLTPYVKFGGENVIAVRLDNPSNSSRWYPGGGIYRNVWLVKTSPVHVAQWGVAVTTPDAAEATAHANLKVKVDNRSTTNADVTIRATVYAINSDGRKAGKPAGVSSPAELKVGAGAGVTTLLSAPIPNRRLWSLKNPNLYTVVVAVEQAGKVVDTYETTFGVRSIRFDPQKGFLLNGERVNFLGVCDHHDLGALGTAINVRALQRQIELLKEMGCNAIRTSHNPPAPELLDLCDRMGMLVMDEAFDTWTRGKTRNDYALLFADWHEKDMRAFVRRDLNHPCVVVWSIGNEVAEQGMAERGGAIAQDLTRIVHEEDMTRPTTSGCNNARAGSGFVTAIDTIGLNYQGSRPSQNQPNGLYPSFHQASPNVFVYGSETASTISSRGEYTFPVAAQPGAIAGGGRGPRGGEAGGPPPGEDVVNHQMSSYDLYYPSWATSPDTEFAAQDRFPFVGGEFVWTGWDYLGEPTPWGGRNDPSRSSYFGIIDLAGFKKDRFYIYQARWRPELPMAHILPHWTWPDRAGQVTPVHVYTSGDEAELFLNGNSLGRKKKGEYEYRIRWDEVTYAPGELKVVAYKNGKPWATDVMKTAGSAAKLLAQADRTTIAGDGQDLSFVTITIADKDGLLVPRSKNKVRFSVSGPGELVATDNGDATSFESFQSKERNAFNGLCLAIVRAKPGQTGTITLKAESEGLKDATITLRSQAEK